MNRRLRKKKRVGEFRELGFPVQFSFTSLLTADERNALLDEWITMIEAEGLLFGGGGGGDVWEGFITLDSRGSASEEHRRNVGQWLESNPRVLQCRVGPLTDAWYGNCDAWYDK